MNISKMIDNRLRVLGHWLAGRRNDTSASALLTHLFSGRGSSRGKRLVRSVERVGEFYQIGIDGLPSVLFFPHDEPLDALLLCADEVLTPFNPHYYEVPETRVEHGDVVADCGASEGLFSLSVAHRCASVFAIEPLPKFATSLRRTLAHHSHASVVEAGLGSAAGEAFVSDEGMGSQLNNAQIGLPCTITTIDTLFDAKDQRLDYLKADVEGFELELLAGAVNTLCRWRPKIAITTYHQKDHATKISRFLEGLDCGYRWKLKGISPRDGRPVMLHAWTSAETRRQAAAKGDL